MKMINVEKQIFQNKLKNILLEQNKNYDDFIYSKKSGFYQGFDEIGIEGSRPTEQRFKTYNIEKYLDKNKNALDIGSNCGFFTTYVGNYLKSILGVEINSYLTKIGFETAKFLKKDNIFFENTRFEDFQSNTKFDIIFSLANDSTIDGNTEFSFFEYIDKIFDLMNTNGYLIFESQAIDMILKKKFIIKKEYLQKKFNIIENRIIPSTYPITVKERHLLILQKSENSFN